MQSELNVFVELADTWETIEGNSDQRAVYRECADGLRMMVDFKRQQIDAGLQPDRAPTHRCTVCGAFWMKWKDSWSLCSKQCGKCCDNVAMCDQIVPLIVSDIYAPAAEITRLTEALRAAEEREKQFVDALIWCSGSADFNEGGQAREGWLKLCRPLIDAALAGAKP